MENKDKIKIYQQSVASRVNYIYKDLVYPEIFTNATKSNSNIRAQFDKLEYKKFSEDWIVNIESFFPSLNQIIRNIRNTLKYEEEILPVERTRRTNSVSIRHLLRNTRHIREVSEEDEIIPNRILNTVSEIDYGIYENRFIMTLIDRLYNYLLNRLEKIKQNMHGFKQTNFKLENEFKINDANYKINFELNAKEDFDSMNIDLHNRKIYERTEEAYKIVSRMYHSDFMRTMSRYQKVKPPILKTQIILKNPDFRNAYMLWLFLDRLHVLDFTLEQRLEVNKFNDEYLKQIDMSLMMLFSTIFINSDLGLSIYDERNVRLESIKPTEEALNSYFDRLNVVVPEMVIEPVIATEYHLEQSKKIFEEKYRDKLKVIKGDKEPLKQIILDQYSIADQIFNSYLNLDQDDDVFDRLIANKDPLKKYNEAFDKYNITKAARQVKEELYLNSIILEDRWIKELLYLQQNAINSIMNMEQDVNNDIIKKLEQEYSREISKLEQDETENTKRIIQNQRVRNNASVRELRSKMAKELADFRARENLRLKNTKDKINEQKAKEREAIKKREQERRKNELAKLREVKAKADAIAKEKLKEDKQKIKEDITNKINDLKQVDDKMNELYKRALAIHSKLTKRDEKPGLSNLTILELKKLAKSMELKGYSSLRKDDLVKFILDNSNLDKLTVIQLRELAKSLNLINYNNLKKNELIILIVNS